MHSDCVNNHSFDRKLAAGTHWIQRSPMESKPGSDPIRWRPAHQICLEEPSVATGRRKSRGMIIAFAQSTTS